MTQRRIGRYEILDVLGQGSMGVVYKCRDTVLNRYVALKTMNLGLSSNPDLKERFYREGKTLGTLNHTNIVSVYELNEFGSTCYIVMEYLEGTSLNQLINDHQELATMTKLEIVRQVCNGVIFAHDRGIIHRDLKPANIFLREDGLIKILDFGVAKLATSKMTKSGVILGTVAYMAPEQLMGETIDVRADVFSIGAIMYELFSYKKPFRGDTITQVMGSIINTRPGDIKGVDKSINFIIQHALEKDRNRRYQTVKELQGNVEQLLEFEKKKRIKTRNIIDKTITSQIQDVRKQLQKIEVIKEEIRQQLDVAELALKEDRFDDAIEAAREVLKRDNAHQKAEKILAHAKKYKELKKEEEKHKLRWIHDRLVEAQKAMDNQHHMHACELCESILKVDAQNSDAKVIKAVCIKKIKDFLDKIEKTDYI